MGRDVNAARECALRAGLATLADDPLPVAKLVKHVFTSHFEGVESNGAAGDAKRADQIETYRTAVQAARQAVLATRANDEIGDDAFHRIEQELDWLEMADAGNAT